jgi:hypothetical protein
VLLCLIAVAMGFSPAGYRFARSPLMVRRKESSVDFHPLTSTINIIFPSLMSFLKDILNQVTQNF